MPLHVKPGELRLSTRVLAILGLQLALCELLLQAACWIRWNTLFFLIIAALTCAIAVMAARWAWGLVYLLAADLLGLILLPGREILLTFTAFSIWLIIQEGLQPKWLIRMHPALVYLIKFSLFNLFLIPVVLLYPQLLFGEAAGAKIRSLLWIAANLGMLVLEQIYNLLRRRFGGQLEAFFRKGGA